LKTRCYILILALFIAVSNLSLEAQSRKVSRKIKQSEKVIENQKKADKKARKKELKRRYDIQTKSTQERIDKGDKSANKYNKNKKESFFVRIKQKFRTRKYR
jgi:hypothetical protein